MSFKLPGRWAALALAMAAGLAVSFLAARPGPPAGGDNALLIGLKAGRDEQSVAGAIDAAGAEVVARVSQINLLVVQPRPGTSNRVMAQLRGHPAVRYAEPDRAFLSLAASEDVQAAPNDPLYAAGRQWNIDKVQAPRAWDLLPPGGNTIVAVLDTGIDFNHPDLAGRISPAACDAFRRTCGTALAAVRQLDVFGHGTHVAGIIGANTNNGIGVASISGGRVTLLPIQVLSPGGGLTDAQESVLVSALVYAVDQGARVVNMSFGGPCGEDVSPATRDAIAYAEAHDVLLVFAAGNSGGCREGRFPQNDSRVISVAATDIADRGASFTDRGLTVAVAAPGVNILSTVPASCDTGICDPSGYRAISGTSMAAPHVAAEAALLFQVPGATKAKVVDWITRTCDSADVSSRCGGRINVYRAVSLAMTGTDPASAPTPTATASPAATPSPTPSPTPSATPSPTPSTTPPATQPAARPAPPSLPAGFTPSEQTLAAEVPVIAAGAGANVPWNGGFWPTAPALTVGLCDVTDDPTRTAADAAIQRFAEASTRGLGWSLVRNDDACDAGVAGPKVLISRQDFGGQTDIARTSIADSAGNPCDRPSCWAGLVSIQVNPAGFDSISAEDQSGAMLRQLAHAAGLDDASVCADSIVSPADRCPSAPKSALGADDIASLNELLAVTLRALRAQ